MASFSRKTGIIGALALAGVLVGGAYLLSDASSFFKPSSANAESTQALLQAYAQKDSDGDGLPDWEEALYGTDPHNAHSVSATLTDGQAVAQGLVKPKFTSAAAPTDASSSDPVSVPGITAAPGSLTDQFAQNLFGQYISQSDGTDPSESDIATYANDAIQQLVQSHAQQNEYSLTDENISGSGTTALVTYAAAAQNALAANSISTESANGDALDYFSDAVSSNNPDAITALKKIANVYISDGPALMDITVPQEAQYANLELANALTRIGGDITDMSMFPTDPLRAYLGLAAYQNDSESILTSFSDMASVFNSEEITISADQPGAKFYSAAQSGAQQVSDIKASN